MRKAKNARDCKICLRYIPAYCNLLQLDKLLTADYFKLTNCLLQLINIRIDESEVEAALQDKTLLSNIVSDASCIAK